MSDFKVGEVAILFCLDMPDIHGCDVTITGQLAMRFCKCVRTGRFVEEMVYEISGVPGYANKKALARPTSLRKKRPPEETTTWSEVTALTGWNPTGVVHA